MPGAAWLDSMKKNEEGGLWLFHSVRVPSGSICPKEQFYETFMHTIDPACFDWHATERGIGSGSKRYGCDSWPRQHFDIQSGVSLGRRVTTGLQHFISSSYWH